MMDEDCVDRLPGVFKELELPAAEVVEFEEESPGGIEVMDESGVGCCSHV